MGRPYLIVEDHDAALARIDGLGRIPPHAITGEIIREYPVSPQYEKGEQLQHPKREKAREMPQMQLCARILAIMAVITIMAVGVSAKSEHAMPILSLHASRIGPVDVQTTISILPSPLNVAVCVGLAGARYPARWGCQFVTDKETTSVTITWRDVPYEDYAIEAGLMQVSRTSHTAQKITQTYRRTFGVVTL